MLITVKAHILRYSHIHHCQSLDIQALKVNLPIGFEAQPEKLASACMAQDVQSARSCTLWPSLLTFHAVEMCDHSPL